jgi:hypothetical protein
MDIQSILIFVALNLINVILSTIRHCLTQGSSKTIAAVANAIAFTFYAAIVKLTSAQDMYIVIITTFFSNLVGVTIALWILDKMKKDKLWRISCTLLSESEETNEIMDIAEKLKERNIPYNIIPMEGKYSIIDIFSRTQAESLLIKEILSNKKVKQHVIVIDKKL